MLIVKFFRPVVLIEHQPDNLNGMIRVRKLLRKKRDFGYTNAEPNELVLTEDLEIIPFASVHRKCQIRFYSEEDRINKRIPAPYCRQGTADFFYITSRFLKYPEPKVELMQTPWPSFLKQGWDPLAKPPWAIMRGLDIFCGGGNLGRGLEEGGAVRFEWAVDYNNEAIHTYNANIKGLNRTKLFRGSINHYLSQAMDGTANDLVAQAGEVEMISAGNPCKGMLSISIFFQS